MKIKLGIVGYGNLGRAVEATVVANKEFELVAIFSRRLVSSAFNTPVEPYENFKNFSGKIDVMLLCGGSKLDLEVQTPEVLEYFDCINTFDTHKKLEAEYKRLGELAKKSGHRLIMACGWDPGLFSIVRALDFAVSKTQPITFWGKGISMGHSDALRRVPGVIDGVQFTVPIEEAVKKAKQGKLSDGEPLHRRVCFVCAEKKDFERVESEIKNIPNYFLGQPTEVNFVKLSELAKLKSKMFHKGQVICSFGTIQGEKCGINYSVSMQSNPSFTASIMTAYIAAILNLKNNLMTGAFTTLDIPVSFLFLGKERETLISRFC